MCLVHNQGNTDGRTVVIPPLMTVNINILYLKSYTTTTHYVKLFCLPTPQTQLAIAKRYNLLKTITCCVMQMLQ